LENEADMGPDQDPQNNIIPPNDVPDLDGADDGVRIPLALPHCRPTAFQYTVTVAGMPPTPPLYVNVWFDWNRDGDWDDALDCIRPGDAPEWAVQNQALALGPGVHVVTTPRFLPWHPAHTAEQMPIWMRITLSEQPWTNPDTPGSGGSGPQGGYEFGETEDYYFTPAPSAVAWRSVRNHGPLGPLAIQLNPAAVSGPAVVSETRNGGIQLIEVDFDQPVVLVNPGGITVIDAGGIPYMPSGVSMVDADTLAIAFSPGVLPDQKCYTIDLDSCVQSVAGLLLSGDTDCRVRGLVGDVNNDEKTNLIDMAYTKSKNGQPVLPGNIPFDVNTDGNVNLIDMALVKSKNGNSALCP
jgi:hypothetical protein